MCVVGSNSLNPGTETTVTTRCLDRNTVCSCVHQNVMILIFIRLA